MKDQVEFCESIVAELARLFPAYPPPTTNAASSKPGQLLTITMASEVACTLLNTFLKSSA